MSEVFALSREMTMNQKMNIFVLDLSFIPWQLLSSVTLGLAGIFWVNPIRGLRKRSFTPSSGRMFWTQALPTVLLCRVLEAVPVLFKKEWLFLLNCAIVLK